MTRTRFSVVIVAFLVTVANAEDKWTPSPLCPYPSEELTRFPYEGDCSKFWECFEGARYPMDCPAGLEFNNEAQQCDTPSIANCDEDATVIYPTYPHSAATQDPNFTPDPLCPYPSEELTFYPCATNCTQYYQCYEGISSLKDCPPGLYWNVHHDWCDYLENVDCSENNSTTTRDPSATTTTAGPWTPDPLCPYPSDAIYYFEVPGVCTEYYECYEGNKYLKECPDNLYWNEAAKVCDYPTNVDCKSSSDEPTDAPATTTVGTTASPGTTAPPGTTASPGTGTTEEPAETTTGEPEATTTAEPATTSSPSVSCKGLADGSYLANPENCHRFYECVGEVALDEECPGKLLWNQALLTCDYSTDTSSCKLPTDLF